jgi:hypothetical protein
VGAIWELAWPLAHPMLWHWLYREVLRRRYAILIHNKVRKILRHKPQMMERVIEAFSLDQEGPGDVHVSREIGAIVGNPVIARIVIGKAVSR